MKFLSRALVAFVLIAGLTFGAASPALAAEPVPTEVTSSTISFFFSWVTVVQFVIQIGLPLIVAVVTTRITSGRVRGILLAGLTVVATVLNAVLQGLLGFPVELFGILAAALVGFVISVGLHFGLWGASGPPNPVTGVAGPSISARIITSVGRTA